MLPLRCRRSKGNHRLAFVVAHPSKTRKGRAPTFVVQLAKTKLGCATRHHCQRRPHPARGHLPQCQPLSEMGLRRGSHLRGPAQGLPRLPCRAPIPSACAQQGSWPRHRRRCKTSLRSKLLGAAQAAVLQVSNAALWRHRRGLNKFVEVFVQGSAKRETRLTGTQVSG